MDIDPAIRDLDTATLELIGVEVRDWQSAQFALAQVMANVATVNSVLDADYPADTRQRTRILEKLQEWLDMLRRKLAEIVAHISEATSFSISLGLAVSVTINFA